MYQTLLVFRTQVASQEAAKKVRDNSKQNENAMSAALTSKIYVESEQYMRRLKDNYPVDQTSSLFNFARGELGSAYDSRSSTTSHELTMMAWRASKY